MAYSIIVEKKKRAAVVQLPASSSVLLVVLLHQRFERLLRGKPAMYREASESATIE